MYHRTALAGVLALGLATALGCSDSHSVAPTIVPDPVSVTDHGTVADSTRVDTAWVAREFIEQVREAAFNR